jgi:membrane protein DedA with SNARE-associated domain
MTGMLMSLLDDYGVLFVFGGVLVAQLGLPIPAIAMLMGAGAVAGDDRAAVLGFAAAGLAGCTIADCVWFAVGRRYGMRVLAALYRTAHISHAAERRIQHLFESYRVGTLVTAKFVPGLSFIAPPLSGASGMSWSPFVLFSSLGSVLWVVVGIGVGVLLADEVPTILGYIGRLGWGVGALLLVPIVTYITLRRWARHDLATRR